MSDVATGGKRILDGNDEYKERRSTIRAELHRRGLEDPNRFGDLWGWHAYWSEHLPTYASRRVFVSEMYQPLLDSLEQLGERELGTGLQPAQTGWVAVDSQLGQLRERYARAETTDDYKAVGLLCRDIFLSVAKETFSEDEHLPRGGTLPGSADAVARLNLVVDALAPGQSNREVRKVIKATVDLANKVQHDQSATEALAALVAEATVTAVNLIRILVLGANEVAEEEEQNERFASFLMDDFDEHEFSDR